jgi:hypothetical protein
LHDLPLERLLELIEVTCVAPGSHTRAAVDFFGTQRALTA